MVQLQIFFRNMITKNVIWPFRVLVMREWWDIAWILDVVVWRQQFSKCILHPHSTIECSWHVLCRIEIASIHRMLQLWWLHIVGPIIHWVSLPVMRNNIIVILDTIWFGHCCHEIVLLRRESSLLIKATLRGTFLLKLTICSSVSTSHLTARTILNHVITIFSNVIRRTQCTFVWLFTKSTLSSLDF